jgi:protein TonB
MYATHYRFSAMLALAVHALAAIGIGAVLVRSLPVTPPQPMLTTLVLDLTPAPVEAAAGSMPMPRGVELPRPQPRPAERAPLPDLSPAAPAAEAADVRVAQVNSPLAPAARTESGSPKTPFLSSLEGVPDGDVDARITGSDRHGGTGSGEGVDAMPAPRTAIKPLYPIGARRRGEAGQVVLDAHVAADGQTDQVTLLVPSGFTDLDAAAERAVKRTLFRPATRGNRPVEARVRITIVFRLTD